VFAAGAQLDARTGLVALLHGHLHELAHARLVNRGERILLHDLRLSVGAEEAAGVVAVIGRAGDPPAVFGDSPATPAYPGEVVRAEAEELGGVGNPSGDEGGMTGFPELEQQGGRLQKENLTALHTTV
jgi:hypothetical protein